MEDNGKMTGLSKEDMDSSLKTLANMAARLGASINVLRRKVTNSKNNKPKDKTKESKSDERSVAKVLIRKLRKDDREDQESVVDLRLAVMGGQDAGKSTLLGINIF